MNPAPHTSAESPANPFAGMPQLQWDVRQSMPLIANAVDVCYRKVKKTTYPVRYARYWFIANFLLCEWHRTRRALRVCEAGIDRGQMRRVMGALQANPAFAPLALASWTGVDIALRHDFLHNIGYSSLMQADIENTADWVRGDEDVLILLHILEHLYNPEQVIRTIAAAMKPGSMLIGGAPAVPHWCVQLREPWLRAHKKQFRHVSKLSVRRVRDIAAASGLTVAFIAGAFGVRWHGMPLENCTWWVRANLWFGAHVPAWPGEIYWVLRKPEI
ncbi:MAG: methyltransferase domain-containing protein [bacterium]|nr:methyltransferase domain-containing protein [bacterium]